MDKAAVAALVAAIRSRGDIKQLAAKAQQDHQLRSLLDQIAGDLGHNDAAALTCKQVVRACRDRHQSSRVRTNPVARDETFCCAHCARQVPKAGRTARDHCPFCLHGLHVDDVPGDRASTCRGLLVPSHVTKRDAGWRIHYICQRCQANRVNRVITDVEVPDSWDIVVSLAAKGAPSR